MLLRTLAARQSVRAKERDEAPAPIDRSRPALRPAREGARRRVRR